jgi:hypothetical protein
MSLHRASSILGFTVAAASLAAALMSGSVFADHIGSGDTPFDAVISSWRLRDLSADALKHDYVTCERIAARGPADLPAPALCAALFEELRVRVFKGDVDALLTWFRQAWNAQTVMR